MCLGLPVKCQQHLRSFQRASRTSKPPAHSRARKSAENKIQTWKPSRVLKKSFSEEKKHAKIPMFPRVGFPKQPFFNGLLVCMANPERALNCASYLNSATPGLCGGDFNGRFWNAPLQHRVRFGWRADFHVVRGFVQADARAPTGSAKPQLLTRIVLRPRWARSVATAIPNGADPTCTVTVPSTFPWSVLVRQNPISGSAGSPLHGGRFRVYAWRRAVDCAPYLNSASMR